MAYTEARRAHVRFYTWMSRLMTPLFQSNLTFLGPPRDLLLGPIGRPRAVRRFMVDILAGVKTGPFRRLSLDGDANE